MSGTTRSGRAWRCGARGALLRWGAGWALSVLTVAVLTVTVLTVTAVTLTPTTASAVSTCGGQKDTCKCGKNNPYPCCANGSNCTWWAWHEACCNWKVALPGWGNANTWHSYAKSHPDFVVQSSPSVGSIATSTKGTYGHVAWVVGVGNGTVTVREMNCCGTCKWGMGTRVHKTSYFNSGFVRPKPKGPVCGNGKCEGGESCAKCAKDCGSCCGNKKCDHGETCTSCAKDCVCLPKGALDVAGSTTLRGWAQDPNSPKSAVTVRLRSDGKTIGETKAQGAHAKVKGHGFALGTPHKLCDNKAHTVTALAVDTAKKGTPTVGKRPLRCRSDAVATGPFATEHHRASALSAQESGPDDTTALATLVHAHPAGSPYATGGHIDTCVTPGLQPFEAVETALTRAMGALPFAAEVRVGESSVATLTSDGSALVERHAAPQTPTSAAPDAPESAHGGGAMQVCLRTWATAEGVHGKGGTVTLSAPHFRRGGWVYGLEPGGHGLRVDLRAETTPGAGGDSGSTGSVRMWRELAQSFDTVRGRLVRHDERVRAELLHAPTSASGAALEGTFAHARLPNLRTLALRFARDGKEVVLADGPPGALASVADLRVVRTHTRQRGLVAVRHADSFGLRCDLPEDAPAVVQPRDLGLQVELSHVDAGWWSTGAVEARVTLPGPAFDRVRLSLQGWLPDPALEVQASADDGAVSLPVARTTTTSAAQPVELALSGQTLTLRLGLTTDRWRGPAGSVVLRHIALCRGGWWTAPSPDARGLFDKRDADGDLVLGVVDPGDGAPSAAVNPDVRGSWLVERALASPHVAVRFTLVQTLAGARLRLLFDGKPVAVLTKPGGGASTVSVAGGPFTTVGLLLQPDPSAPGAAGSATVRDVELRGVDGVWRSVAAVPVALGDALAPGESPAKTPDEVGAARERPSPSPTASKGAGCAARPVPGTRSVALLALAATLILWRRRRRVVAAVC